LKGIHGDRLRPVLSVEVLVVVEKNRKTPSLLTTHQIADVR
jgi:hypothetical protein